MGLVFQERTSKVIIKTNNGVERQNKDFKREFLVDHKENTLSGMLTVLVKSFLPDKYNSMYDVPTIFNLQYLKPTFNKG